jgi:hypothetical protein
LLDLIYDYVQSRAIVDGHQANGHCAADKVTFSRRELRETFKWSEYQLRTYLDELEKLEYVWPLSGRQGQPFQYRLLYRGEGEEGGRFLLGLKTVEQLRLEARQLVFGFEPPLSASRLNLELRGEKTSFEGTSLNGSHEVKPAEKAGESRVLPVPVPTSRKIAGSVYPQREGSGPYA